MADQGAEGFLSPYCRSQRTKAALPYLKGKILDFGCGSGALAGFISPDLYFGVDIDKKSLLKAKKKYPAHYFEESIALESTYFDTIVILAVIEHVSDPTLFLKDLSLLLSRPSESSIVLTTPHPYSSMIHLIGSRLGMFSKEANEEHKDLLNIKKIKNIAKEAGLEIAFYKKFLFGLNQLFILRRV